MMGQVAEGQYTETVYSHIKDKKYEEVIRLLSVELQNFPRSRAALSLLGHCYYMMQDFLNAVQMYEQLIKIYTDVDEYRIYYAQSLYKAGLYDQAHRAALRVESPQYTQRMTMLQAAIKYEQDELAACKALLDRCLSDDPDTIASYAAIAYKEEKFDEARQKFVEATILVKVEIQRWRCAHVCA